MYKTNIFSNIFCKNISNYFQKKSPPSLAENKRVTFYKQYPYL